MERRFKLIGVSIEIVASYGKGFEKALLEQLSPGSAIVMKKDDIYAATLFLLIYHPGFGKLAALEMPPNMPFEMSHKPASPILKFDH